MDQPTSPEIQLPGVAPEAALPTAASPAMVRLLAAALDATSDHVYVLDAAGRICFASPAGPRALGLAPEDLIGKTPEEVGAPPELAAKQSAERARVLATGEPITGTLEYLTLAGLRDYEYTMRRLQGAAEDGQDLVLLSMRDVTDHARADAALRESEERFRLLADSAPVLMWLNDATGCVFVNHAYMDYLGVDRLVDVRGYDWAQFIHPEDRDAYIGAYVAALERRGPFEAEFRFRRHDGAFRWMHSVGKPRLTPAGAFLGYVGYTFDIHETREATARLRESEERFRAAVNHASVGVALVGEGGRTLFVNPGLCQMLGYTEEELLALSFADVTHPDDLAEEVARVTRMLSGETDSLRFEKRYLHRSGRVVWADISLAHVPDSEGETQRVVGVVVDITEQKQAQRRLLQAQEQVRLAHEVAEIGIWRNDLETGAFVVDERARLHYGFPPGDLTIADLLARVHPDDVERLRGEIAEQTGPRGGGMFNTEYRVIHPDGAVRWLAVSVRVRFVGEGEARRATMGFGTTQDITERKRADLALREHSRAIEALNRRLQDSMRETHHRVKNNLQVVSALVEMQGSAYRETVPAAELDRIGRHVRSLAALHDLLTHQARTDPFVETLSLAGVFKKLEPLLRVTTGGRELALHVEDAVLPVRRMTALALVVNELVSNAVKHAAGPIEVRFHVEGDRGVLAVADRGTGFPASFDPSRDSSTGLELVQTVVRWDLDGDLAFLNPPEGGGRVEVRLGVKRNT